MKKFTFSLERVLNYKEQVEQSLRSEHGQAVRKVKEKEAQIEELETGFARYTSDLEEVKAQEVSAARLRAYEGYLGTLIGRIAMEKKNLLVLEKEEERKREQVIEAKKETSSIQKLKEKKQKEYAAQSAKLEEREIEEFVSNRSMEQKKNQG